MSRAAALILCLFMTEALVEASVLLSTERMKQSSARRRRRRSNTSVSTKDFQDLKKTVTELKAQVVSLKKERSEMQEEMKELKAKVSSLKSPDAEPKPAPVKRPEPAPIIRPKPAPVKPPSSDEKLAEGERYEKAEDVKKGDNVQIRYAKNSKFWANGKEGTVTHVGPRGSRIKGDGITATTWWRWDFLVKLDREPTTTTTTTTTETPAVLSAEGSVRLKSLNSLCIGMWKVEYPDFATARAKQEGKRAVTALTGESDSTQHMVFLAPCTKSTSVRNIKVSGEDDPHIRWIKQPGGFYKNVQYGMCLRYPKSDGRGFSDKWKGTYLGIGTTDCDPARAGPFIEQSGHLKLFCSHHGKEKGHGLQQSECLCGFYTFHPMWMASLKDGAPNHKVYLQARYCGNKNPLTTAELP